MVLRSDEIRKRQWSVGPLDRLPPEAYQPRAGEQVHRELFALAGEVLATGRSVVLDATFLEPARRDAAQELAESAQVRFDGVWLQADEARLRERLAGRSADASDATEAVLAAQQRLDPGIIDWPRTDGGEDVSAIARAIARRPGD